MPILKPGDSSIELPTFRGGQLMAYTFPGLYPIFYVASENARPLGTLYVVCAKCGNTDRHNRKNIIGYDVNYDDASLYCDVCDNKIESAYGDDDA